MLNSSGESGHPCLTPLPTFPGSEYSPSILTRICCPMYRFPISILSLQSIRWLFSLMASSNIFLGYIEVVSQVLPLSVFHETPSLALTSSVIRPSGSSPLGLAYTGEDSVVHHDLCVQQGDLVKV